MRYFQKLNDNFELDHKQLELLDLLENYLDKFNTRFSFIQNLFNRQKSFGIYIWGDVGTGKSLILKHFFEHVNAKKTKLHLHEFMEKLHNELHILRSSNKIVHKDPIKEAVGNLLKTIKVLCLDEFEVHDIASAMMLERVLLEINKRGIFIVITSNTSPKELYKDGLKRDNFLSCINYIQNNFEIYNLDNNTDYRRQKLANLNRYIYPLEEESKQYLDEWINILTTQKPSPIELKLYGRSLKFETSTEALLITNFQELCTRALSGLDYRKICKHFKYIILDQLPAIEEINKDSRKRLVHFIDIAYDYNIFLIIRAKISLEELAAGFEEFSEISRAKSRLVEMQSLQYFNDTSL